MYVNDFYLFDLVKAKELFRDKLKVVFDFD